MRYILTPPVPNGNAWWEIHDTQNKEEENMIVAAFERDQCPNAEREARELCERLNVKE